MAAGCDLWYAPTEEEEKETTAPATASAAPAAAAASPAVKKARAGSGDATPDYAAGLLSANPPTPAPAAPPLTPAPAPAPAAAAATTAASLTPAAPVSYAPQPASALANNREPERVTRSPTGGTAPPRQPLSSAAVAFGMLPRRKLRIKVCYSCRYD